MPMVRVEEDFEAALRIFSRRVTRSKTLMLLKERRLYPRPQDRRKIKAFRSAVRRRNHR
ncbi:MAG: 30S ribosomal protein S21 [Deltaproteobacteria bacterium]|nr:30S ribosomal protein S21 [Deltaproteobacteria bacterium]MBW2043175.1 30S ribosomal protein S21 [Deltaproteobacteria bacterium]MBW2133574.1 30S ribosomal protein S21 [Deltaproteobacteria bacterium]